jgi:anthranilate/para-aminobenzoate synthase component I
MIVDLERTDLSRVCEPGSVRWRELMGERELAGVVHLVSAAEGTSREEVDLALTIRAFAGVEDRIHLGVGGGIAWDSEPDDEIAEAWVKARPLLDALRALVA